MSCLHGSLFIYIYIYVYILSKLGTILVTHYPSKCQGNLHESINIIAFQSDNFHLKVKIKLLPDKDQLATKH